MKKTRKPRTITASDAYPLQRPFWLAAQGKITWDRFVDALNVLFEGGDVDAMDFGDAEPVSQRVWRKFRGQTVRLSEVAKAFGAERSSEMGPRMVRLAQLGLAVRVSHGLWRFAP